VDHWCCRICRTTCRLTNCWKRSRIRSPGRGRMRPMPRSPRRGPLTAEEASQRRKPRWNLCFRFRMLDQIRCDSLSGSVLPYRRSWLRSSGDSRPRRDGRRLQSHALLKLHRSVALKMPLGRVVTASRQEQTRFVREAEPWRLCAIPTSVLVYDIGEVKDTPTSPWSTSMEVVRREMGRCSQPFGNLPRRSLLWRRPYRPPIRAGSHLPSIRQAPD